MKLLSIYKEVVSVYSSALLFATILVQVCGYYIRSPALSQILTQQQDKCKYNTMGLNLTPRI
jgi:hypothetical protein